MNSNNQNISIIDFNKICRICMSEGNLVEILTKCETKDCIFEMLACCTLTMVSEKDELPDKICLQCLDELKVAYKFYQKSEVSDNILNKLLKKSKQSDQANPSTPSKKSKNQSNGIQNATEHNENDEISPIKIDISVNLDSDAGYKINIHNDHTYIAPEKVCENENNTPNETVLNCNQNNTADQTTNSSKTKNGCAYECHKCSVTLYTYRQLRLHWMTEHGAKYAERECEVCNKFIGFREFKQHMRSHPQYKPFKCDMCSAKYRSKWHLQRHKKTHFRLKSNVYPCDQCAKRYTRLETLQKHIVKHHSTSTNDDLSALSSSDSQGHVCHVCERCFKSKTSLNQHILIHGDKKYLCWFCGKSFATASGLLLHVKIHTGIRPYRCSYCSKSFIQSGALKTHMYTHTGEKPYICEFCSKSFTQTHHLKYHIRMHTGVKPHKCSICAKCFVSSSTLKIHMRIHTGVTPYVCEVCTRGFSRSSHLRKHMKRHLMTQDTGDNALTT